MPLQLNTASGSITLTAEDGSGNVSYVFPRAGLPVVDANTSVTDTAETRSAAINMADNVVQRPVLKDYAETKVAMAANDVDLALGNVQTKTISGAQTLTFSNPPASGSAGSFTLILTNGGSATVTWPTSVDWPLATAPTLTAAGVDVLFFTTIDGGTIWYGTAVVGMG